MLSWEFNPLKISGVFREVDGGSVGDPGTWCIILLAEALVAVLSVDTSVCVLFSYLKVKLLNYNHRFACEMSDKDTTAPTIVQTNLKLLLENTNIFPLIGKFCIICYHSLQKHRTCGLGIVT